MTDEPLLWVVMQWLRWTDGDNRPVPSGTLDGYRASAKALLAALHESGFEVVPRGGASYSGLWCATHDRAAPLCHFLAMEFIGSVRLDDCELVGSVG